MSGDFLDSNVIIYLFDDEDPRNYSISHGIVSGALDEGTATISFQVVQETLNVLSRGMSRPVTDRDIREAFVSILVPLWTVMPSPALYERALNVRERYGFSFYDSLIVAAALEAGCDRLLSEDLQDGQVIEGLRIENPFAA